MISGNVGTGQEIVKIEATDGDFLSSQDIVYEILSTRYIRGDLDVLGANNLTIRGAFAIDRFTGKVSTQINFFIKFVKHGVFGMFLKFLGMQTI